MNKNRFAKQVAFYFLFALPALTCAQGSAPSPVPAPPATSPAAHPHKAARSTDVFEGLQFTDDQKEKIIEIRRDIKMRMDAVAKDEKLTADQKEAMVEGYRHMENSEIFKVLTPEQQAEVRKRVHALREAKQQEQQKKLAPH